MKKMNVQSVILVKIEESRPLSKDKRYRLIEIIEKVK